MRTPRTLSAFDARDNGITSARLLLALAVVLSHTVTVGGYGREPLLDVTQGAASLGSLAVIAFFALSGFLLAGSRERTPVVVFLRNRALRILPAYWLALGVTTLVALPIAAAIRGVEIDAGAIGEWVAPRLLFLGSQEVGSLSATFAGGPLNGSLWTLGIEVGCYLLLAITPSRWLRPVIVGALGLQALAWGAWPGSVGPGTVLLLAFSLGAAAWLWRARIPMSGPLAAVAAGGAAVALHLGWLPVGLILFSFAALGLALLPFRLGTDLSYGVYVLACPIQQVLATAGLAALGPAILFAASIAVILPAAFASWRLVERPAMSLRSRGRPDVRPSGQPGTGRAAIVAAAVELQSGRLGPT